MFYDFLCLCLASVHQPYYAQLPELYRRLTDSPGKRLILVGGSNVAFGVDTGLLERTLAQYGYEYTVCPFGLYAAVGAGAMLELSQGQLREGDVVVLSPACAAFDQFKNFMERGKVFKRLVNAL